jgi:hypothetical protein
MGLKYFFDFFINIHSPLTTILNAQQQVTFLLFEPA